jgi:hypothetical protein
VICYHATTADRLPSILASGLVPGLGEDEHDTFQPAYHWPVALAHLYPVRPIYVSIDEPVEWMPGRHADNDRQAALLEVETSGLKLLPDLPTLCDLGMTLAADGLVLPSDWRVADCLHALAAHCAGGAPAAGASAAQRTILWAACEAATDDIIAATGSAALCQTIKPERLAAVDWTLHWPHHWHNLQPA